MANKWILQQHQKNQLQRKQSWHDQGMRQEVIAERHCDFHQDQDTQKLYQDFHRDFEDVSFSSSSWSTPSTFRFDDSGNSIDVGDIRFDMVEITSSSRAPAESRREFLANSISDGYDKVNKKPTPDVPIEAVLDYPFTSFSDDFWSSTYDANFDQAHLQESHQEKTLRYEGGGKDEIIAGDIDDSPTYHLSKGPATQLQFPMTSLYNLLHLQQAADVKIDASLPPESAPFVFGSTITQGTPFTFDAISEDAILMRHSISSSSSSSTRTRRATDYIDCGSSPFASFEDMENSLIPSSSTEQVNIAERSTILTDHGMHEIDTPSISSAHDHDLDPQLRAEKSKTSIARSGLHSSRPSALRSKSATDWSDAWPKSDRAIFSKMSTKMYHSLSEDSGSNHLLPPHDIYRLSRPRSSLSVDHQDTQQTRRKRQIAGIFMPNIDDVVSDTFNTCGGNLACEEKQDRFDQLSDALRTLKTPLHQGDGVKNTLDQALESILKHGNLGAKSTSFDEQGSMSSDQQPRACHLDQAKYAIGRRFANALTSHLPLTEATPSQMSRFAFHDIMQSPLTTNSAHEHHIAALYDLTRRLQQRRYADEE